MSGVPTEESAKRRYKRVPPSMKKRIGTVNVNGIRVPDSALDSEDGIYYNSGRVIIDGQEQAYNAGDIFRETKSEGKDFEKGPFGNKDFKGNMDFEGNKDFPKGGKDRPEGTEEFREETPERMEPPKESDMN